MSAADYKAAKEAFVSGLNGGKMMEISLLSLPVPAALWAYAEFKVSDYADCASLRMMPYDATHQWYPQVGPSHEVDARLRITTFFLEFTFLIFPLVLMQSLPELVIIITLALLALAGILHAIARGCKDPALHSEWRHRRATALLSDRKVFVTNYRASTMLLTCIAILAVDFPLFPRRLAKTETFGTGYMDLGVGSFVFSSGLSSRGGRRSSPPRSWGMRAREVFLQCVPLLLLGSGRLVLHKGLDYQQHVSEYGVHWNFFLTLACVHVLSTALRLACPPTLARLALSLLLLVLYQAQLSWGGLTSYVLEAPRDPSSFFSMNREGVLGVVGYWALHLAGESLGSTLMWPDHRSSGSAKLKNTGAQTRYMLSQMAMVDGVLWFLMAFSQVAIQQPISRRLVNLPYVLWVSAYNVMVIGMLMAVDAFASIPPESDMMEAANRSQLAFFLLANLLTGAVNLSMYTLFTSDLTAFVVVLIYMGIVTAVFLVLHKGETTLKFW